MHWGRIRTVSHKEHHPLSNVRLWWVIACTLCVLWGGILLHGIYCPPSFSVQEARQAAAAFSRDHASIASLLQINEYFPDETVPVGTFQTESSHSFREYMTLALRRLFSIPS